MRLRPFLLIPLLVIALVGSSSPRSWQFSEAAKSAGIEMTIVAGSPEKKLLVETMTGGCCVLDYNNDGWPDLFLVNGATQESWDPLPGAIPKSLDAPTDRLYRNKGDGTFNDVTQKAGLLESAWGMGCVAADFDNDGDTDLYVTNFGPNFLYRNNGDGTFTGIGKAAGVDDPRWSTGAAFGDYDRDGLLDLYVANYVDFDFQKPAGDPRFCSYRGVTVACGPRGLPGAADVLYRNRGDGTFADVSKETGINDSEKLYGFQPVWTDYDLDGDLDIFVANDSTPNFLWRNNGNGTFTDSALLSAVAYNQEGRAQANMGVDVADYDGDGTLDIYSTNFSDDYNVLYRNSGKSFFTDATFAAKVAQPTFRFLGFGTLFADLDNDTLPDLFVANGHIYPEVDLFRLGSEYRQRNQVFRNLGDGTFEEIGPRLGPGLAVVKASRGAALLDWDRDGDLDIVVCNLDDPVDLLRNDLPPGSNYLQVSLRGRQSNRDGIGARIMVLCGKSRQLQELHSSASYLSTSENMLHFGLGTSKTADMIEVIWPSGKKQKFDGLSGNRRIVVDEDRGVVQHKN